MLDNFTISHKGGVVLWSRSFTPTAATLARSNASPVNNLIRDALIEGRDSENKYEKDGYAVRWTLANDLELIFVVAYQRILQLSYVEDLLTAIKTLFIKLYNPFLTSFVASLHTGFANTTQVLTQPAQSWNFTNAFKGWDKVFDKVLRDLEQKANQERRLRSRPTATAYDSSQSHLHSDSAAHSASGGTSPTVDIAQPQDAEAIAKNVAHLRSRMKGRGSGAGAGGKKGKGHAGLGSGSESDVIGRKGTSTKAKSKRVWGDVVPTEDDMSALDYSVINPNEEEKTLDKAALGDLVDERSMGIKKGDVYEIKDWEFSKKKANGSSQNPDDDDDEIDEDFITRTLQATSLNSDGATGASAASQQPGYVASLFSRITGLAGTTRPLSQQDLAPILEGMKSHLMKKNVARDIAERVCDGVGKSLEGRKVGGFKSIKSEVRNALEESITRILTPKTSTDILHAIRQKRANVKADPYSMTFVGVNGVGKSTNLSKVAFWLLQNDFRVLIAACDTFRSGAVEQLRVHVRNLSILVNQDASAPTESKKIDLFEKGYGKDAAGIAKDAIAFGKESGFDVVLIDTAGRMQDNEPLMRALAKLVATNNPDKIIFVGEALVGNEAVDQLTKFDRALKDFSSAANKASAKAGGRGIDGMLVTKWDTVDDKVGAALSMTFVTGQPILFVGCGQTYTDLRQLRVSHVVHALLSD